MSKKEEVKEIVDPVVVDDDAQEAETVEAETVEDETQEKEEDLTFKQICDQLVADGATRVKNVKVLSCRVTPQDNYTMVSLTIDRKLRAYVADEDGVYDLGKSNVVFASSFSLASVLKQDENVAFAANTLVENPKGFEVIMPGSTIDLILQDVSEDELYKNPFSTTDDEGVSLGHDTIIKHVVKVKVGKRGMQMLDAMALKMMGY